MTNFPDVRHERTAELFRGFGITRGTDLDGCGLTDKQRAAVCMYLGLDGIAPTDMPAIALVMHSTKQAVLQLLQAALTKVRRHRYASRPE
jgi:hypothetical protein